jgi:hypothetical protein
LPVLTLIGIERSGDLFVFRGQGSDVIETP